LREHGFVAVREELRLELIDPGASRAFAVADHWVAHVYVNDKDSLSEVRALVEKVLDVEMILDEHGKAGHHLNHAHAGELIAVAAPDAWFSYYY
jgi:hypothetical protein